jgi:nucleoside-diphosphate-sugar epimerase
MMVMESAKRELLGTAFVTGSAGFIGRHLLRALISQGREIIALCRQPGELDEFDTPSLRVVVGTLEDLSSYSQELKGVSTIFHLAAKRPHPGIPLADFMMTNVDATLALARISRNAGIKLFINVSTALIFGSTSKNENPDLRDLSIDKYYNHYLYSRSKAQVELEQMAEDGLPLITVFPSIVFGPDTPDHPNRITDQIRRLLLTRVDVVLAGGFHRRNLVYVIDIVDGLLLAERVGQIGDAYIFCGEDVSHRQLNQLVLAKAGLRPRISLSIPRIVAQSAAKTVDWLRGYEGGSGYLAAVNMLLTEWCFTSTRAENQLGYNSTPFDQALDITLTDIS